VSITRTPLGGDLVCLVCHKSDNIDIDHVINRGMGGSKERDVPENKVPLCRECHTAKTNGVLETQLFNSGSAGWCYLWRRKGTDAPWISIPVEVSERYKCLVLSAAAEEGAPSMSAHSDRVARPSAAAPSAGIIEPEVLLPTPARVDSHFALTHEQRVAIAANIKDMEWGRQWMAGDWANAWESELGEEAWQYLSEFGYQPESLSNIMRVCAAIPPKLRRYQTLRFSHHVVVAGLNREDMEMWLDKCEEEQWSVAEFRRQVKGTKLRVRRWSLKELWTEFDEWHGEDECVDCHAVDDFFRWLGGQG